MISIVYDVDIYRKILRERVNEGDIVIEIGPHIGKSTSCYERKVKLGILVDKSIESEKGLQSLLKKNKNLKFIKGDARSFKTVKKVMELTNSCNFLALDVGGGRYPDTVFKIWAIWSGVFKPKNSVIRNRGLAEFVQKLKIEDKSLKRKFRDDGWLSEYGRAIPSALKKQLDEFKFWVNI
ncbi:MAG: SAM-dependent methyltransferase [Candidatus Altiarchaeota archaeon]